MKHRTLSIPRTKFPRNFTRDERGVYKKSKNCTKSKTRSSRVFCAAKCTRDKRQKIILQNASHKTSAPGYIMVFSLMIIAICVIVVFRLLDTGMVHSVYLQTLSEREQARELALGGIECALSQLADQEEQNVKTNSSSATQEKKEKESDSAQKKLLERILPALNRWQVIPLQEKTEGIDAELKICIMAESGKININKWYDFDKHTFVGEGQAEGDTKKAFQIIFSTIQKSMGQPNLFESFEKFLKQRHYRLNDVTELLAIKEFEIFKDAVFYDPPASSKEKKEPRKKMYLTDIFTTWPATRGIEPWLFSDSVANIFSVKRADESTLEEREKRIKEWLKQFKPSVQWSQDWKTILMPVYGKDLKSLPQELIFMLSTTFEATMFSVLSYATVGSVTHKLCAIIERYKESSDNMHRVRLRKIYWL